MSDALWPEVHWGSADAPLPDWRADPSLDADSDPDDELLDETPPDVVAALGFDPLELDDDLAELNDVSPEIARRFGLDAQPWKEEAHPRDNEGKFASIAGGGMGAGGKSLGEHAEAAPHPKTYLGKAGLVAKAMAVKALTDAQDPEEFAAELKDFAKQYKHPSFGAYVNSLLKHLESAHGLKSGALGKAELKAANEPGMTSVSKAKFGGGSAPTPAPAPQSAFSDIPKPPQPKSPSLKSAVDKMYAMATMSGVTDYAKAHQIVAMAQGWSNGGSVKSYANELLDKLGASDMKFGTEAEPTKEAPKGPEPHAGSPGQKKIHEIATGAGSDADKIEKINGVMNDPAVAGMYTKQFGEQWIEALGGAPATTPAPTPTPKPAAAPKPAASVTKASPSAGRIQRALAAYASADKVSGTYSDEAKQIAPSLAKSWWSSVSSQAQAAVKSYCGSGYVSMNSALRIMGLPTTEAVEASKSVSKHTLEAIDYIDDLFEREGARITSDVVMHRGEDVPAEMVQKWKAALSSGLPVRYMKDGFISASLAGKAAFSSKSTQFEIVVRKGTPALGIDTMSGLSENEVLMRHGQSFEIFEIAEGAGGKTRIKMISLV